MEFMDIYITMWHVSYTERCMTTALDKSILSERSDCVGKGGLQL